jgi:hypothetical protein
VLRLGRRRCTGEEERRMVRVGKELGVGLYRVEGEEEGALKAVGKDSGGGAPLMSVGASVGGGFRKGKRGGTWVRH